MSTPNFYMVKEAGRSVAEHYVTTLIDAETLAQNLAQKNVGVVYVVLAPIEAFRAVAVTIESVPIEQSEEVGLPVMVKS